MSDLCTDDLPPDFLGDCSEVSCLSEVTQLRARGRTEIEVHTQSPVLTWWEEEGMLSALGSGVTVFKRLNVNLYQQPFDAAAL